MRGEIVLASRIWRTPVEALGCLSIFGFANLENKIWLIYSVGVLGLLARVPDDKAPGARIASTRATRARTPSLCLVSMAYDPWEWSISLTPDGQQPHYKRCSPTALELIVELVELISSKQHLIGRLQGYPHEALQGDLHGDLSKIALTV